MALYPYSSTHRLEVTPAGGLRKDLSESCLLSPNLPPTPHTFDATREPAAYRELLAPLQIGPRLLDSGPDWIVVEKMEAVELWQIADFETWIAVAESLAEMHRALMSSSPKMRAAVPLADHRVGHSPRQETVLLSPTVRAGYSLARRVLRAERCELIHGDFYPSNVMVASGRPERVIPIDWELLGRGPQILDLASLVSGEWSEEERLEMARAFFAAGGAGGYSCSPIHWRTRLNAALLHVCVRWLLPAPGWTPPDAHRHEWAQTANYFSRRILENLHE